MSSEGKKGVRHDQAEAPVRKHQPATNKPDDACQKALADEIMREDREVLKELAK